MTYQTAHRGSKMTTQSEAAALVQKHRESIDYFTKYGNSLEKAIAQKVLDLAEVK